MKLLYLVLVAALLHSVCSLPSTKAVTYGKNSGIVASGSGSQEQARAPAVRPHKSVLKLFLEVYFPWLTQEQLEELAQMQEGLPAVISWEFGTRGVTGTNPSDPILLRIQRRVYDQGSVVPSL
uniref:Secreted protein n=1 Tax=Steinernema glaseri TaxID=37863 RepID=A0A1I7YSQ5_9BILA